MRNAKVTSNISCDELCNAIRFLIPPQIAVSWNSSETLSEIAWRFRKRNKDFHKIFSIDRKLKSIFDELDSLMDPEFFNKNSFEICKGTAPPREAKERIVRIYRLEVMLLETLLRTINMSAPIEIKLSIGSYVIGLEEIEHLKELGKMLEDVLNDEVPFMTFYKFWLQTKSC